MEIINDLYFENVSPVLSNDMRQKSNIPVLYKRKKSNSGVFIKRARTKIRTFKLPGEMNILRVKSER